MEVVDFFVEVVKRNRVVFLPGFDSGNVCFDFIEAGANRIKTLIGIEFQSVNIIQYLGKKPYNSFFVVQRKHPFIKSVTQQ